jgi:hypothetical protein
VNTVYLGKQKHRDGRGYGSYGPIVQVEHGPRVSRIGATYYDV